MTIDFDVFAPAGVFVRVFAEMGIEISMREARAEPMGLHKRDHIRAISHMERVAAVWVEEHGRPCSEGDVEAMFERFVPLQLEVLADHAQLIPEVPLARASFRRRGLAIGTTTGYNRQMMDVLVLAKRQGYEPDHIVCAMRCQPGDRLRGWFRATRSIWAYSLRLA